MKRKYFPGEGDIISGPVSAPPNTAGCNALGALNPHDSVSVRFSGSGLLITNTGNGPGDRKPTPTPPRSPEAECGEPEPETRCFFSAPGGGESLPPRETKSAFNATVTFTESGFKTNPNNILDSLGTFY